MNERMVVMNGSRIFQHQDQGKWVNSKVQEAGSVKPGIYRLHSARAASRDADHSGQVIHADRDSVYQNTTKGLVRHDARRFDKGAVPLIGSTAKISYNESGRAQVQDAARERSRSRNR